MPGHRQYEGRHRLHNGGGAGDAMEVQPEGETGPEQPDNVATGGEALEEQQRNPDLDDTSGTRP